MNELSKVEQAIIRVLFKHRSMEQRDLSYAVFKRSISEELDNLVDNGYVNRIFMGKHPFGGYPYDKFVLGQKCLEV